MLPEATSALVKPEEVMGFLLWPENPFWSFQFLRVVEEGYFGGADFTECYLAVRDLQAGDVAGWYERFSALAADMERRAERAAQDGHRTSARQKWLRASNYYRAAGSFYTVFDAPGVASLEGRRRCFQAAARLAPDAVTPIEIPYEGTDAGTTLPGYLCAAPEHATRPTPAAIVFGGGDAVSEEMYFRLGGPLAARGFTVLLLDGPGQGEALRRGIINRYDWEVPVGAAIDALVARAEVDPQRIAVVGSSMGGFYAARAAAFEPRLAACVVWGGAYDLSYGLSLPHSRDPEALARGMKVFGAKDLEDARAILAHYTLQGITARLQCPVLVVTGEAEMAFTQTAGTPFQPSDWYWKHPRRLYDEIQHDRKTLFFYPIGTPGALHDQADADAPAIEDISDWLETTLRAR